MSKEYDLNWSGMLTKDNIRDVASLMTRLLLNRRYTIVEFSENFDCDVKTSHRLDQDVTQTRKAIDVYADEAGDTGAGFFIRDTYGMHQFWTNLKNGEQDKTFINPHFTFDGDRVVIKIRAGSGLLLKHVFAVEKD